MECLLTEDLALDVGVPQSVLPASFGRQRLRRFSSVVGEARFCQFLYFLRVNGADTLKFVLQSIALLLFSGQFRVGFPQLPRYLFVLGCFLGQLVS